LIKILAILTSQASHIPAVLPEHVTIQYNTKFVKRHVAVASEALDCLHDWLKA